MEPRIDRFSSPADRLNHFKHPNTTHRHRRGEEQRPAARYGGAAAACFDPRQGDRKAHMGRGKGTWPRRLLVTTMVVMLGARPLVRAFRVRGIGGSDWHIAYCRAIDPTDWPNPLYIPQPAAPSGSLVRRALAAQQYQRPQRLFASLKCVSSRLVSLLTPAPQPPPSVRPPTHQPIHYTNPMQGRKPRHQQQRRPPRRPRRHRRGSRCATSCWRTRRWARACWGRR